MANPLQPKCDKLLREHYGAFTVIASATTRNGVPDILACLKGMFYGFEIKWRSDTPSEVQKVKINNIIDAGGAAYFIHSEEQLRKIIDDNEKPVKYKLKNHFIM